MAKMHLDWSSVVCLSWKASAGDLHEEKSGQFAPVRCGVVASANDVRFRRRKGARPCA